MDDLKEKQMLYIRDLINHKKYFFESAYKLSSYFLENNQEDMALEIVKRAFIHDFSKLSENEFSSFMVFKNYNSSLKNADVSYCEEEKVFLTEHWKHNRHHPEYWSDINDMSEIDIAEMVCDWHARSTEFNTDLREFIAVRQENRFQFSEEILKKVTKYVEILLK